MDIDAIATALSGSVAIGHLAQARLEPEVVLHFASTPPPSANDAELLAHVDWIALGYEIVQCHFPKWTFETADAVCDVAVHGTLIVGPPRSVSALSDPLAALRSFNIELAQNGAVLARGGGTNVLGSPLRALADVMAAAIDQSGWEPIRAGEIVTTGTLTALHTIRVGETWSAEVSGIDLDAFSLEIC